jgi:uncharacterized protein
MNTEQHTSHRPAHGPAATDDSSHAGARRVRCTRASPERGQEHDGTASAQRAMDLFLAKDMKGWSELCDENVVVELPFSPDPAGRKIVGRAAIYAFLKDYPKAIDIKSLPTLKIHATEDPNVAIAEWSVSGRVVSNGNPYELSYATVVTVRNGLIVNYREYFNPQAFLAAMSGARF